MDNEKIKISNDLLIKYYKGLIKSIYKILPIFEGKDINTKRVIYLKEVAFEQYQKYASNLLIEIYGNSGLFFNSNYSIKIISILSGMLKTITIDDHEQLRSLIFQCTSLCNKIIEELEVDNNGL